MVAGLPPFLSRQFCGDPGLLVRCEKYRFCWTARQEEISDNAEGDSGQAFQDEEPAPTADRQPMDVIQDQARNWSAQHIRDRHGSHKQRDHLRLFALPEPIRQVQNDTWEEASLGNAEQEASGIQLQHALHGSSKYCYDPPTDQDAGNPNPCSDLVQEQIAWDLKEEVPAKENAREQSELGTRDGQGGVHCQGRETNVDAVEEGNNVQ